MLNVVANNTLLHSENKDRSGNSGTTAPSNNSTGFSSVNSQLASTSQINNLSDYQANSEPILTIKGAHHVALNNKVMCLLNNNDHLMSSTLLAIAVIELASDNGRSKKFRVLLGQGSECSFLSERVLKILRLSCQKIETHVYGVGGEFIGTAKRLARVWLRPKENSLSPFFLQTLVLQILSSYSPPEFPRKANPQESDIDAILGADKVGLCLLPGLEQGTLGTLTAQNSIFDWILSDPVCQTSELGSTSAHFSITTETLHEDLSRFWEIEAPSESPLTEDEVLCEEHFINTHKRLPSGRYMVRLPFKNGPPIEIGDSFEKAKLILQKSQARLQNKPDLFKEYSEFLTEYQELNHMELSPNFEGVDASQTVYLPHHPILRESSSTTRLRVVFNASSLTSNGTSLNSHLYIGPKLLTDLVSIILRWRKHSLVYVADVEKMFRQIRVDPRDCDYQRILKYTQEGELQAWRLITVIYGTACAPYLANRVIKQLAKDEGINFPLAKTILEDNLYVDDVLFRADDVEEAKELRR